MKIDFEGRTWDLDLESISMDEAVEITSFTGVPLAKWEAALTDADHPAWLKSLQCLYWLMRAQNSEPVPLGTGSFAVLKFYSALGEAVKEEAGDQAAEADPTKPAGASGGASATPLPVAVTG